MKDTPDWARILKFIYDNQKGELDAALQNPGEVSIQETSSLLQEVELDQQEVRDALVFMYRSGLISANSVGSPLKLTPRGFQVAHERRMQERRDEEELQRMERQQELEDKRVERQEKREDQRAKRQHEINQAVAYLTLGLMVVTVIDSAVRVHVSSPPYDMAAVAVALGVLLVFVFTLVLYFSGLLSPLSTD